MIRVCRKRVRKLVLCHPRRDVCVVQTPVGFYYTSFEMIYVSVQRDTNVIAYQYNGRNANTASRPAEVFAVWSPTVASVPLPAPIFLLGGVVSGLAGLGRLRRPR